MIQDSGCSKKMIQDSGFRIQLVFLQHKMIQKNDSGQVFTFQKNDSGFRIQDSALFFTTRNDSAKMIQVRFS